MSAISRAISTAIPAAATQQTRYIKPVLVQCWASVLDGGPALHQHWRDVSYLLGVDLSLSQIHTIQLKVSTTSFHLPPARPLSGHGGPFDKIVDQF